MKSIVLTKTEFKIVINIFLMGLYIFFVFLMQILEDQTLTCKKINYWSVLSLDTVILEYVVGVACTDL